MTVVLVGMAFLAERFVDGDGWLFVSNGNDLLGSSAGVVVIVAFGPLGTLAGLTG